MWREPTCRDIVAALAPRGRERGKRPLNSCVELEDCMRAGREVLLMVEGPSVADLLSFEGEGGAVREWVARVIPMLLARDFCLNCRICQIITCKV